ncbi:MAG TPA: DUF2203 domain-containing protein [Candidatus Dormibacteraeota bacterium]|nr:DUF2203 domain-containing protein [Candidatus Dormibacteraeota bacterium]
MEERQPENQNPKLFTLAEAERARQRIEPLLTEAIEHRGRALDFERSLTALAQRIQFSGGLALRRDKAQTLRKGFDGASELMRTTVEQIEASGCQVKDIDLGLIDFPGQLNGEDVFWCWRLGEDRIRFWHRQSEGFAGRKPISPSDAGATPPVQ